MNFRNTPTVVNLPGAPEPEPAASTGEKATLEPAGPTGIEAPVEPWNPLILPFTLLMFVLIFSAMRDVMTFHYRYQVLSDDNGRSTKILQDFQKQQVFLSGIHADLVQISNTDPVAAQILTEFFSSKPSQATPKLDAAGRPVPPPAKDGK